MPAFHFNGPLTFLANIPQSGSPLLRDNDHLFNKFIHSICQKEIESRRPFALAPSTLLDNQSTLDIRTAQRTTTREHLNTVPR